MTTLDWLVLLAGIAAIIWVNWYFFVAEPVRSRSESPREER